MKLIILDRDGVINFDSQHYIKSPDEWLAIPGSLEAIAKLKAHGYKIAVATNQSGIARGLYDEANLQEIHQKMQVELEHLDANVDFIAFCPHHPSEECDCRKPKTGLLRQISEYFNYKLDNVYFVGDSGCDIKAALTMNCLPILVKTGNGKKTLSRIGDQNSVPVYENLLDFVNQL